MTEIPYLIVCATLYFACWYFTTGLPVEASVSGHVYLQMICESQVERRMWNEDKI